MISLSKRDIFSIYLLFSLSFTVYFLNLYLLFNLDAPSPVLCVCMCEEETPPAFLRVASEFASSTFSSVYCSG